ncbi:hypothetical protein [Gimesia sp.]|uniref:hypothetical protein n=1 Tax=Gimesia sp. TaxID=2024833 RepID=UPI0032ECA337
MSEKKDESLNEDNPNNTEINSPPICIFWLGLFGVIGFAIGNYFFLSSSYCSMAARGQFGDMYGALNSIFSGLAFVAVAFTLWEQRVDLKRQHQQNNINQEFIKAAARREERRYRNDVLPKFLQMDSGRESGETKEGFIKVILVIENVGNEISDAKFIQLRDEIPLGIKMNLQELGFIDKNEVVEIDVWYPENEPSKQKIDMSFETNDNVMWNNEIILHIDDNQIQHFTYGNAREYDKQNI